MDLIKDISIWPLQIDSNNLSHLEMMTYMILSEISISRLHLSLNILLRLPNKEI